MSGLKDVNYTEPTELQNEVIPHIREGKNIVAKAKSGMGKDGSYIIPILEDISGKEDRSYTRALVLTPEVDHAKKIDEFIWVTGYHAGVQSAPVAMDGNREDQKEALQNGTDIIVANPGQLQKMMKQVDNPFIRIDYLVIDEAEKLTKIGIIPIVEELIGMLSGNEQRLFYSSEMNRDLEGFVKKHISDPVFIGFDAPGAEAESSSEKQEEQESGKKQRRESSGRKERSPKEETQEKAQEPEQEQPQEASEEAPEQTTETEAEGEEPIEKKREDLPPPELPDDLKQGYINVPGRLKISTLMAHLDESPEDNVLIFTASKRGTDRLFNVIRKRGKTVRSIHERLPKEERERRYRGFKEGEYQFLLITDISARDIDFDHVKQVINYDVPNDVDEYRYRADLVGSGKANRIVSLVSKQDKDDIAAIEKEVGVTPNELPLPEAVEKKRKRRSSSDNNQGRTHSKKRSSKSKSKSSSKSGSGSGSGSGSSRSKRSRGGDKSRGKKRSSGRKKRDKQQNGLPKPNFDKLEGGRKGKERPKRTGLVRFIKNLFS